MNRLERELLADSYGPPVVNKDGRVLLLGGPFDFRTVALPLDATEYRFPLPNERPFLTGRVDSIDDLPLVGDLKVARYAFVTRLVYRNTDAGRVFEYMETR